MNQITTQSWEQDFSNDSKLENYPLTKLILNRLFNYFVKVIFLSDYNDFTNAFKIYKKRL